MTEEKLPPETDSALYAVKLTFSGKLTYEQKGAIVRNIMSALIHATDTAGLVPEGIGEYTAKIHVGHPDSGEFQDWNIGGFHAHIDPSEIPIPPYNKLP